MRPREEDSEETEDSKETNERTLAEYSEGQSPQQFSCFSPTKKLHPPTRMEFWIGWNIQDWLLELLVCEDVLDEALVEEPAELEVLEDEAFVLELELELEEEETDELLLEELPGGVHWPFLIAMRSAFSFSIIALCHAW